VFEAVFEVVFNLALQARVLFGRARFIFDIAAGSTKVAFKIFMLIFKP